MARGGLDGRRRRGGGQNCLASFWFDPRAEDEILLSLRFLLLLLLLLLLTTLPRQLPPHHTTRTTAFASVSRPHVPTEEGRCALPLAVCVLSRKKQKRDIAAPGCICRRLPWPSALPKWSFPTQAQPHTAQTSAAKRKIGFACAEPRSRPRVLTGASVELTLGGGETAGAKSSSAARYRHASCTGGRDHDPGEKDPGGRGEDRASSFTTPRAA
ncbi:hypothetical protein LX32DRAFT_403799 [Colletotrichum zoysiae]|uniref:Uncharacterized protein n=1 Tax=Colletotrichum zoysiae TaxID=1216348 RepID=A0AAD9LZI4_9PEZI|nr:hypothetical protein LX32DRAFT_403799 [Colletotrichum zoysiae]